METQVPTFPEPLLRAVKEWPLSGMGARLLKIYAALPATTCARRNACCGLLPPTQPVEMLAFLRALAGRSESERRDSASRLAGHFLQNAARRLPCPWSLDDSCARYDERFFGCRAYGLWSPAAYEPRRRQSLRAAQKVQEAWCGMGIRLPDEVRAPPPAYCRKVEALPGAPVDDANLENLEEELAGLGNDQPWHALLSQCGGDLSYLIAGLALGWQECLQAKVAFTRDSLSGRSQEAEAILGRAEEAAGAWSIGLGSCLA